MKIEREIEDSKLVQRFKKGDMSAFSEIVERHKGRLFKVVLTYTRNREDAEEIVQDVFISAHRNLNTFRGDSALSTWLHRIAMNRCINKYWYDQRRKKHLTISLDLTPSASSTVTFADMVDSQESTPDRTLVVSELARAVREGMRAIKPIHSKILVLWFADLSYEDIARQLGITMGTVKSRIARARESLETAVVIAHPELSGPGGRILFPPLQRSPWGTVRKIA